MVAIRGHFDGKVFVPDEPVDLPRNQSVILHVQVAEVDPAQKSKSQWSALKKREGSIDAPSDSSAEHDHYLYCTRPGSLRRMVKRFPLRPLRSRKDHLAAGVILDEMVGRGDLSSGEQDYLDALVHFVTDYERETLELELRKLKPVEVLRELLAMNNMNTSDLGSILGTRGLASEVLNRKRGLSKTLIARLAQRFKVSPSLFLSIDDAA